PPPPVPRPPETRADPSLPLPPPPMPAPPPIRQAERLPGLYLPEGFQFTPPQRQAQPRQGLRGLDLSLGPTIGRMTPEPQMDVRGAQVGPDWRNAFRRWLEEHKRYPEAAIVLGQSGSPRVHLVVSPDGRVTSVQLTRRSGSVWLDAGLVGLFNGARLPPFPPGADPSGVRIDFTMHYILIRN
ncbi:MAG: TonB family protein, partial [Acetobacteraceae bacterium]|nr:TonB family protein [Acetobacteraceae bacterium]